MESGEEGRGGPEGAGPGVTLKSQKVLVFFLSFFLSFFFSLFRFPPRMVRHPNRHYMRRTRGGEGGRGRRGEGVAGVISAH